MSRDFLLFAPRLLFHWILLNLTHWTFDPNQPRKTASSIPSVRLNIMWRSSGLCSGIQKMCAVCAAVAAAAVAAARAHFVPRSRTACRGEAVHRDQLSCSLISAMHAQGGGWGGVEGCWGQAEGGGGVLKAQGTTSSAAMQHCSTAAPRADVHSAL